MKLAMSFMPVRGSSMSRAPTGASTLLARQVSKLPSFLKTASSFKRLGCRVLSVASNSSLGVLLGSCIKHD
jgi:hypothetical protein